MLFVAITGLVVAGAIVVAVLSMLSSERKMHATWQQQWWERVTLENEHLRNRLDAHHWVDYSNLQQIPSVVHEMNALSKQLTDTPEGWDAASEEQFLERIKIQGADLEGDWVGPTVG